jgi:hypothetical protein
MNILNHTAGELIKQLPKDIIADIKMGHKKQELIQNFTTFLNYNKSKMEKTSISQYFISNGINEPREMAEKVIEEVFSVVQSASVH